MDREESVEVKGLRYREGDDVVVRPYKERDEEVWNKTIKEKKYDKQKDEKKKPVAQPKNGWIGRILQL